MLALGAARQPACLHPSGCTRVIGSGVVNHGVSGLKGQQLAVTTGRLRSTGSTAKPGYGTRSERPLGLAGCVGQPGTVSRCYVRSRSQDVVLQ